MEVFLLTTVVVTLFLVFVISIWRELNRVSSPDYKFEKGRPTGGRYTVINLLQDTAERKAKKKKVKKTKSKSLPIRGTVSDMESDGVYFKK
jgi:hypothetical protein